MDPTRFDPPWRAALELAWDRELRPELVSLAEAVRLPEHREASLAEIERHVTEAAQRGRRRRDQERVIILHPPRRLDSAAWDEILPVLSGEHEGWCFPPGFTNLT